MKKSILSILIVLFAFSLKSQIVEDWSTPVALTDSISNNSNPIVVVLQVNGTDELFMFYEKGIAPYRNIYWKKISEPMSEEQLFFGVWPEVDYRNPQILNYDFLIFECNVYENYDIFGVRIDENGLAGDIFRLTDTDYDESSFITASYSGLCCWESQGNIISATPQISQDTLIFTDLEIVDSGNCFDPICKSNYIAWRKIEDNESHIYYSRKTYPLYQWSEPDTIINTNDNINLSLSTSVPEMEGGYTLCWEAMDNIYFSSTWGTNIQISSPIISGIEKYYEPTAFNLIMLTDDIPELYSFSGETDSIRDIYIVDEFISGYVLNITEDTNINKNPRLFCGRVEWPYYEIINVWQTEIDGFDVLFESHAWYIATGEIDEDKQVQLYISPNPISNNQLIIINSPENILIKSLQVFSSSGEIVQQEKFRSQSNKYEIDLNNHSPGIYFIKIQTSHGETVRKIIKNN